MDVKAHFSSCAVLGEQSVQSVGTLAFTIHIELSEARFNG